MRFRWLLAVGAALAFALLTLPPVPHFWLSSTPIVGAEFQDTTICAADPEPANLELTLTEMNGEEISLASYKGNVILLNFWATWCGPCKIEIPWFVEFQDKYREQGLIVLGLSVDDPPEKMRLFAEEYNVNYPMLVGLDREDVLESYGPIWGIPISVFISGDGMICKRQMGITTKEHFEEQIKSLL